jgi:hypothetical protein
MHCKNPSVSLIGSSFATLAVLLAGCGGSNTVSSAPGSPGSPGSSSASSFSVSSSMPASGATGVALTSTIQITFSSAANATTVNTTDIVVTDPSGAVSGTVSYNASSNTATFTPSAALAGSTTYTVKVSGVTGSSGGAMASADTFSFTTAASPSAALQYQAPLGGNSGSVGQVTVDTDGNVAVQLNGATASTTFSIQFCYVEAVNASSIPCFAVGSVDTNASGDGSTTTMFPKSGAWAGDFQLITSAQTASGLDYYSTTGYGTGYMSTLVPNGADATFDGSPVSNEAPLASGSIAYASSPSPNGSLTFTLTGAVANDVSIEAAEGGLVPYDYYSLGGTYTTNGAGDVTFTVAPSGQGGDIFDISPQNGQVGWEGGFSVP